MAFDLQTYRCQRSIGFRVEAHGNCTFDKHGNMIARNPWRTGDAQACRDHLQWTRREGPFISFFTSWKAALRRQQFMLSRGAEEVVIVAVWLEGLTLVYDALQIARDLGLGNLDWFRNEVLVHGAIYADNYRILAIFPGNENTKEVVLHLDGLNRRARIPGEFIDGVSIKRTIGGMPDVTELLQDEIYSLTGTRGDAKLNPLVLSMADGEYF
ncbi:uncharacterized protein Triagg1_6644 [Trichoderma aggressivum f. europaeum]|uniref:Uncharacterized protein n=1 Tax=Trichoderma aggressivum f. europaeum TaxID=173218 RepID=A0AAE1J3M8_9HYPO|nr:hypothetical protein Triagg1_6644 [Trichoderma aggressivum f. europaeum]